MYSKPQMIPPPLLGGPRAPAASSLHGVHLRLALPRQVSVHRGLHPAGRRAHREGAQPCVTAQASLHRSKALTQRQRSDRLGVTLTLIGAVFKNICSVVYLLCSASVLLTYYNYVVMKVQEK